MFRGDAGICGGGSVNKPTIQRCPECLSRMKLIRGGIISKCKKCGGQYDPTYVMGFTDGYNKGIRKRKA
jgi:hypothetical protein